MTEVPCVLTSSSMRKSHLTGQMLMMQSRALENNLIKSVNGVQFVSDVTKYISGCMASLSAMIQLELPHVNVLTKVDLLPNKRDIER